MYVQHTHRGRKLFSFLFVYYEPQLPPTNTHTHNPIVAHTKIYTKSSDLRNTNFAYFLVCEWVCLCAAHRKHFAPPNHTDTHTHTAICHPLFAPRPTPSLESSIKLIKIFFNMTW